MKVKEPFWYIKVSFNNEETYQTMHLAKFGQENVAKMPNFQFQRYFYWHENVFGKFRKTIGWIYLAFESGKHVFLDAKQKSKFSFVKSFQPNGRSLSEIGKIFISSFHYFLSVQTTQPWYVKVTALSIETFGKVLEQ